MIAAVLLLSMTCKQVIGKTIDRAQADKMTTLDLSLRHDALISCTDEKMTITESLHLVSEFGQTTGFLLERAVDYMRAAHVEDGFWAQPAKTK